MADHYRLGEYQRVLAGQEEISMNLIFPPPEFDESGNVISVESNRIKVSIFEAARLIRPYISVRFMEQLKAVVPLAVYLALFQILFLRHMVEDSWLVSGGLFAVIIGLMFFMEGLNKGLMPLGNIIGNTLPKHSTLPLVLFITLILGIGVTFAEPAIGALQAAGQIVVIERAPYLYALLNFWSQELVLVVGVSVGLAAVLGTLRFLYGWSLKPIIYLTLVPILLLTLFASVNEDLRVVIGLAWDCGALTTGPVTVPLVLSLGIGIASAAGKGNSGLSGFGIVTLASLFPVIGVMLLYIYIFTVTTPAEIIEAAKFFARSAETIITPWYQQSPGEEFVSGVRAILPLVIFLFFVLKFILKHKLKNQSEIIYGITLTIVGMCIFNVGLTYGLSKLGGATGGMVPIAFMEISGIEISPIYKYSVGLILALVFAWVLGFGATLAEPALNALGVTTEKLTNGVFKKKTLINAVSIGVGCGIAAGLAKIIFNFPLAWLILPGYLLAIVLTIFSTEEFVNVAWDSAGVTTGPITVPLVLAMGLGFGNATQAIEGFGILCLASIGPILSVLITGLWSRYRASKLESIESISNFALQVKSTL